MTLTDDLHDTAAALRSGWPIQNLNRARRVRAKEQRTMSDNLQERAYNLQHDLKRLHDLARGWSWPDSGEELQNMVRNDDRCADEAAKILSAAELTIDAASSLITDLCVEVAGLRARCEVSK